MICLAVAFCLDIFSQPKPKLGLLFPYGDSIFEATESGPRKFGEWPGSARPRDAFSYPGGFVAFERGSGSIYRASEEKLQKIGKIEAAEVFLSRDYALARGKVFEPEKGFVFTLYKLGSSVKRGASFHLDCFPSDCVYASARWFLAGSDKSDTKTALYEINPVSGSVAKVGSLPKNRDFGRIVVYGDRLWLYASCSDVRPVKPVVLAFFLRTINTEKVQTVASEPERLELRGVSPDCCLYGSGFALNGKFWLPLASGQGSTLTVTAASFDPLVKQPTQLTSIRLDTGMYAAIGETGGRYYMFGYLYARDTKDMRLVSIAPDGLRSWALP
jgi:hypothetical protein